jgi:hypothetical protein
MAYIKPKDVHSPKAHWKLVEVIIDEGPDCPAYAIGTWAGERRIGFRWNGNDESPLGNPQSRGLATWTMLDEKLHPAVIALAPSEKQKIIAAYLDVPAKIELVVDWHPSGRRTLKEREAGTHMYRDLKGPLFANLDTAAFYRAVAMEIASRQLAGQHVTYIDTSADGEASAA